MAGKETQLTDAETSFPWNPVEKEERLEEMILSFDPETGSTTRLLRFPSGYEGEKALVHAFWEEAYLLEGSPVDLGARKTYSKGSYACRPPGMKHGPCRSPQGCLSFETRTHPAPSRAEASILPFVLKRKTQRTPVQFLKGTSGSFHHLFRHHSPSQGRVHLWREI